MKQTNQEKLEIINGNGFQIPTNSDGTFNFNEANRLLDLISEGSEIKIEKVDVLPTTPKVNTIYRLNRTKELNVGILDTEIPPNNENTLGEFNFEKGYVYNDNTGIKVTYEGDGVFNINNTTPINLNDPNISIYLSEPWAKGYVLDQNITSENRVFASIEFISGTLTTGAYKSRHSDGKIISFYPKLAYNKPAEQDPFIIDNTGLSSPLEDGGVIDYKNSHTMLVGEFDHSPIINSKESIFTPCFEWFLTTTSDTKFTFNNVKVKFKLFTSYISQENNIYVTYMYDKIKKEWVNVGNDDFEVVAGRMTKQEVKINEPQLFEVAIPKSCHKFKSFDIEYSSDRYTKGNNHLLSIGKCVGNIITHRVPNGELQLLQIQPQVSHVDKSKFTFLVTFLNPTVDKAFLELDYKIIFHN